MHEVDFEPVLYVYDFSGKTFHVYDLTRLSLILLFRHRTIKYTLPPPLPGEVKNRYVPCAMSTSRNIWQRLCLRTAIPADCDVRRKRKRAFGVAKRPREIYSAKARRQDAHFLRK